MKTILCYGDSNTWGYVVGSVNFETGYCARYPYSIRWTGRLQQLLGNEYLIIEEGLCGRTTNVDNPLEMGGANCNGKAYLASCLFSHAPIDWVVLMLGGNDFKSALDRTPEEAAEGLAELIQTIQSSHYGQDMQSPPKILLLGYPYLKVENGPFIDFFQGATQKSKIFPGLCESVAKQYNCAYLDISTHIKMSAIDGLHIDKKDQKKFARLVANRIILNL